jgi:hypothetical protein
MWIVRQIAFLLLPIFIHQIHGKLINLVKSSAKLKLINTHNYYYMEIMVIYFSFVSD